MNSTAVQTSTFDTSADKSRAAQYLARTCDDLNAAIHGLSEEQWHFKPAADKWSIGEVVEHLTIAEERVQGLIGRLGDAQPAEAGRDDAQVDDFIVANVPERANKFVAPPILQPTGNLTPQQLLVRFALLRSQSLRLLDSSPHLRGRTFPHPVFGPWDGYQWLLGTAAHTARHLAQIAEVKAHPAFPREVH